MKNKTDKTLEVGCLVCGWVGSNDELTFPHNILDDDYPDYGGDCPSCGERSPDGEMVEYEEYLEITATNSKVE